MQLIKEKNKFYITGLKRENKYKYKKYTRQEEDGSRTYNIGNKKIPSVTTILSATQSEDKKAGLDLWRERVGYQEAARITSLAARRGTEMHYVLENYIDGRGYLNLSLEGSEARLMAHEIVNNLDLLSVVWGNEVSLSYKDRWAGSTDVVGIYDKKPTIMDFKQSNKMKKREWIDDYFIQLAAYADAHNHQFDTNIRQGVVLMASQDGFFKDFVICGREFDSYLDQWRQKLKIFTSEGADSSSA